MPPTVPDNARLSAVLCLLYPVDGVLHVALMKRMEDNTPHSGQVSFPGGRYEQEDTDLQYTALREAGEEMGIMSHQVDVLGPLTSLYIPVSNFNVFPFVGYAVERPAFILSQYEVRQLIEVPLDVFTDDRYKTVADVVSPAYPQIIRKVKAYRLADGTVIWGATAMMLSELEWLVREHGGR